MVSDSSLGKLFFCCQVFNLWIITILITRSYIVHKKQNATTENQNTTVSSPTLITVIFAPTTTINTVVTAVVLCRENNKAR